MSLLEDRAVAGVLAERRGDRAEIVGAIGIAAPSLSRRQREVPEQWTVVHVADRLEEAYRTLARLPMTTRPRAYANSMPAYPYDRGDLNSQMETYELERLHREQNRVRLPPSPAEVQRMEEALRWPMLYLADKPEIAAAVGLMAKWEAINANVQERCRAAGLSSRFVGRRRWHGLRLILGELVGRRVPVR